MLDALFCGAPLEMREQQAEISPGAVAEVGKDTNQAFDAALAHEA
jgi:hypothetical protein